MSKQKEVIISELREHHVVKHNYLIQKSRYQLSTLEQKVILYLITKIKPSDNALDLYEFSINEFCSVCGIDEENGKNYILLKKILKELADKSLWITLPDKTETLVRWVERPYISMKSGIIKIKLDELMMPYLLQLKDHFTAYNLYYTLAMKSKYSIRLYELIKSYENLSACEFDLDELKKKLFAENYATYKDFRVKVIDIALREINDFTDIFVSYTVTKKGKKADRIRFEMQAKIALKDRIDTFKKVEHRISSNQAFE